MKKSNSMKQKIRVAVLFGGRSGEHEVSLRSAANVIQNLDRDLFEVVPVGISKQGSWFLGEDVGMLTENLLELPEDADRMLFAPNLIGHLRQMDSAGEVVHRLKQKGSLFDVIFPVIHGTLCEDGTVQGLLELAEVPYVGCGVLSSAVGMDKDVSKRLALNAGLNVPPFLVINQGQWEKKKTFFCDQVCSKLKFPLFVKPANTGSSVGVQKIKEPQELVPAIENAFTYDTKILVEEGINAREIELSVLESLDYGCEPIVSMAGEICPQNGHEFYSYASKYLDEDGAKIIIPAPVSETLQQELQAVAKTIFAALDCEGMARVDLFVEKDTQRIYFNEINTIPGFTEISMYPKLLMASGISYSKLLTHLIDLAIDRHTRKSHLSREYLA
nr:D-alanine--D-alanine ligase [uncultured bacterium]